MIIIGRTVRNLAFETYSRNLRILENIGKVNDLLEILSEDLINSDFDEFEYTIKKFESELNLMSNKIVNSTNKLLHSNEIYKKCIE